MDSGEAREPKAMGDSEFLDGVLPATASEEKRQAVCWECGRELLCREFVVCCTGTLFHLCPECEAKIAE